MVSLWVHVEGKTNRTSWEKGTPKFFGENLNGLVTWCLALKHVKLGSVGETGSWTVGQKQQREASTSAGEAEDGNIPNI